MYCKKQLFRHDRPALLFFPGLRQAGKRIHLILAAILICSLTGCGASGTKGKSDADAGHAPITIMSANKDDSGFIEYVKSVYPEIDIQIVPYRGANTAQYMFDQLHTGHMPDIYSTTQMFTCYAKYPEHLIDLSKYGFNSKYKYELEALAVCEFSVRRAGQWLRHDGGIRRHHIRHVHPRGNSVTNKVQGTDLGMAITKRLVKRMGGQVSLKTQKGKDSVFTIDLELQLPDATDNVSFYRHDRQCLLGGHSHGSAPGARAGIAPGPCLRRMGSAEILQLYLWSVDVIHICEYNCIGRFRCSCTDNQKYAKRLAAPC